MSTTHPELLTEVREIRYRFVDRTGVVLMAVGCCVDMTGAIALFSRIDPDVRRIETYRLDHEDPMAGIEEVPDTFYHRRHGHVGRAVSPDGGMARLRHAQAPHARNGRLSATRRPRTLNDGTCREVKLSPEIARAREAEAADEGPMTPPNNPPAPTLRSPR